MIDPNRLGGLEWTRSTQGTLSAAERRRLLGEIVRYAGRTMAGRVKLATGRVPAGAKDLATSDFAPPDSRLARAAEEACREQGAAVIGHSYRTWLYGSALAALDRSALDPELFYVASLLHDHGLENTKAGQDFTLRSADRAARCVSEAGRATEEADAIGDAITVHATPGATLERDGALGYYVQHGAVLDLSGARAEDLTRAYRADVCRAHPRDDVMELARLIRAEGKAVPRGRFALLHRCGFTVMMRVAPRS